MFQIWLWPHILFKVGGQLRAVKTGSTSGLHLRLNLQMSEYFYGPSTSAGFKV